MYKSYPYKCHVCPRGFTTPQRFQDHLKEHSNVDWPCEICGKIFNTEKKLKEHSNVHSQVNGNRNCKHCGVFLSNGQKLLDHMNIHSGLKPYSCEPCDRTFFTKNALRGHNRRTHEENFGRNFECESCPKKFLNKVAMQDHIGNIIDKEN